MALPAFPISNKYYIEIDGVREFVYEHNDKLYFLLRDCYYPINHLSKTHDVVLGEFDYNKGEHNMEQDQDNDKVCIFCGTYTLCISDTSICDQCAKDIKELLAAKRSTEK